MKYRKKPVVIEAFQFYMDSSSPNWFNKALSSGEVFIDDDGPNDVCYRIKTLEGLMIARPGDYIIQGIKGEIYPCKADIFEASYEAVE